MVRRTVCPNLTVVLSEITKKLYLASGFTYSGVMAKIPN